MAEAPMTIWPMPVDKVKYLSMSGCTTIDGVDDLKEFEEVSKAMLTVGLSADDSKCIWECIAALMLLGNIEFGSGDAVLPGEHRRRAEPVRRLEE